MLAGLVIDEGLLGEEWIVSVGCFHLCLGGVAEKTFDENEKNNQVTNE